MDDRLALRLGALRLARRRGRTRDAAWAASRLRLDGLTLQPNEARFAREMLVQFGRALRIARIRRPRPAAVAVSMPLLPARTSRRRRIVAALAAAALLIAALLLYVRLQEPAGDLEGAQPVQQAAIATPPPPLRGRTQPGVAAPVAIVEATPAPTDAPVAPGTPGSGTGTTGGGAGAGGSGGGTGNGNALGTPAPTVRPTATPSPAPTPTIDPSKLMHVDGTIADSRTRRGIPNVCVSLGSSNGCLTRTDANGFFAVDLEIGRVLNWGFNFITPGYRTLSLTVPARAGTTHLGTRFMSVAP